MNNGAIVQSNVQVKVGDEESVTTKAGTFDTFKIVYALRHTNPRDPTRTHNVLIEMFYAPAVNHWVKRHYRELFDGHLREDSSLELVDYSRKQ